MQEKNKKINNVFISNGLDDTIRFAYDLAKNSKPGDIYCLEGELGVGKTVIAKGIGKFFNVEEEITSPTFTILKSYDTNDKYINKIHHFDLYRIKNNDELINIGFEEYIYDNKSIVIIEWPEIAYKMMPKTIKRILISKLNNSDYIREIKVL